jgi:hypothetical protein
VVQLLEQPKIYFFLLLASFVSIVDGEQELLYFQVCTPLYFWLSGSNSTLIYKQALLYTSVICFCLCVDLHHFPMMQSNVLLEHPLCLWLLPGNERVSASFET